MFDNQSLTRYAVDSRKYGTILVQGHRIVDITRTVFF
jgi:hypothetical protein